MDGDGKVSPAETTTFEQVLDHISNPTLLAGIVRAYADSGGAIVDLGSIFAEATEPGAVSAAALTSTCTVFYRGDANGDSAVDNSDPIYVLPWLYQGGPAPPRLDAADIDDDGIHDISDPVYLNNYLFFGGPAPPIPFAYLGLDPTLDSIEANCDLVPGNYAEFHTFYSAIDITRDGVQDPLYIVPTNKIEIDPLDSTKDPVVFATLTLPTPPPSDPPYEMRKICASNSMVVYALTDEVLAPKVYWFRDTLPSGVGDGVSDQSGSFSLPSMPIDAVLIDTADGQALVTLHDINGTDSLYLWKDNNADGIFDDQQTTLLVSGAVHLPKGLAVDSKTARVFITGQNDFAYSVVAFYQDTDGDKLVDSASTPAYMDEVGSLSVLQATDLEFLGLHFVADARKLLVLTDDLGQNQARLVACARDREDLFTVPASVSLYIDQISEESNAIYAIRLSSGAVRAWVTIQDWLVYQLEASDCTVPIGSEFILSLPNSSETAANNAAFLLCNVRFTAPGNRQGWSILRFDSGTHQEGLQKWIVNATKNPGSCPRNASPATATATTGGGQAATAVSSWSDGQTRTTQFKARLITRWASGPDIGYCCPTRRSEYKYHRSITYHGLTYGFPATDPNPLLGGTFREDPTFCGWQGEPEGAKDSWDSNGWREKPLGTFSVAVSPQKNEVSRFPNPGGRNDGETTFQSVTVSVHCRAAQ